MAEEEVEMEAVENEDGSVSIILNQLMETDDDGNIINLAVNMSEEDLVKLAEEVITSVEKDEESREDWRERRANHRKLFACLSEPKNTPFEGAANVKIPTIATAALQYQARAYSQLLGAKEIVRGQYMDGNKKNAARRVGRHMNYLLKDGMPEWEPDMDAMFLALPLDGSCFKKTYRNYQKKQVESLMVSADDFVVPFHTTRLESAERKTHKYKLSPNDLLKKDRDGEFLDVSSFVNITPSESEGSEVKTENLKNQGLTESAEVAKELRQIYEQHRLLDLEDTGIGQPYVVTVDVDSKKVLRIESARYIDTQGKERTFEFFTHYEFIPNPDGLYAFGFGLLLEGINESINTTMNQLLDAGTLNNLQAGFMERTAGMPKGGITLKMGEFTLLNSKGGDLRKSVVPLPFGPPSQVLLSLMLFLKDEAQRLSTVSDTMLGQLPPSDTTATSTVTATEQGLKVFSSIQKRTHRSFKSELAKIRTLNSIFLDEEEYKLVQDSAGEDIKTLVLGKKDYSEAFDIVPVSDPNIVSRAEELAKAQSRYQVGMTNPLISGKEQSVWRLTRDYYEAMGTDNLDELLPPIEEPPPPPDLPPYEENAMVLREEKPIAIPVQDHEGHLNEHQIFMKGADWERVTPQGKKVMEAHILEHNSMSYLAKNQAEIAREEEENARYAGG